jgi:hypothetical protein
MDSEVKNHVYYYCGGVRLNKHTYLLGDDSEELSFAFRQAHELAKEHSATPLMMIWDWFVEGNEPKFRRLTMFDAE